MVMFALFTPVLVALLIFVIDVNNWLEHQQHLQLQADSAALAAAQAFQPCNNANIYQVAGQYGGAASVTTPGGVVATGGSLYNGQVGRSLQSNIHELINSRTFYGQGSTSQPATPDDTATSAPCQASMVDVKMTETGLPWYFRALSAVPYIDAHARLSIDQATNFSGALPVAVNELNPVAAEAYFVDESAASNSQLKNCGASGTSPCAVALTNQGSNSSGQAVWADDSTPIGLPISKSAIGVRIALAGRNVLTGNMATDCALAAVTCFDANAAGNVGILHIQGFTTNGTASPTNPLSQSVTLYGAPGTSGCSDGYFSDPSASCQIGVNATINWGSTTASRPQAAEVDAIVGTTCYALTPPAGTFHSTETWSSASTPGGSCTGYNGQNKAGTGYIPLSAGTGSARIDLQVSDKTGSGKTQVTNTFTCATTPALCNVQRSYTGDIPGGATHSGPIQGAWITQVGGLSQDADSFPMCASGCTQNLIVTVDITGTLQDAQSVADPLYTLRFDGTGSQNQSISCSPANGGSTFSAELASGCAGNWTINPTLTCPDTVTDCVPPATGNKQNQVASGMNQRILGSQKPSSCTNPNHWPSLTFTNGIPNVSATDPRVIYLFVTPYGAFSGNGGSSLYPIASFAAFYVTGWQDNGNGFNNPCQGNGDDTAAGGTIVGHFIKYINTVNVNDGGGGAPCQLGSLDICVAVLTR